MPQGSQPARWLGGCSFASCQSRKKIKARGPFANVLHLPECSKHSGVSWER